LSALSGADARELQARTARGHAPWLAQINGEPVGWGWCAAGEVSIGELGIAVPLPPGNRYLWDCFTVPAWRGRGIYPRLLQAIIAHEPEVARFWVGHDHGNLASARGIAKAGFHEVGLLYHRRDGEFELVASGPLERAVAASDLFAVPVAGRLPAWSA
jgi:RimJ/RimL family protein N-acetyltransferase